MKKTYLELKMQHQKDVNELPLMFAFGDKQFLETLEKNNLTADDIIFIGGGGFIRKSDKDLITETFKRHGKESKEAQRDPKYFYDMIMYELGNHEYQFTRDLEPTLSACGLEWDSLTPEQAEIVQRAKKDYFNLCIEKDWF